MQPSRDVARLIEIMRALRQPVTGCPWDVEQTFATIAPYTLEEAYEVADAAERGDLVDLREELGDLLLQVVFHAQMADEQGAFDFGGVVEAITSKLIRRHPHVFGPRRDLTPDEVKGQWDAIKAEEKAERAVRRAAAGLPDDSAKSALDGVPDALPALTRAVKLQSKAAKVGFDWDAVGPVLDKIEEEIAEAREALASGRAARIEEEIGDLFFAMANLARHAKVDPEEALRRANAKFVRRFAHVEAGLAVRGKRPEESTLEEMDALWDEARAADKARDAK
jgi:ATP diphosphatase